jgi:Zn-dependent alcohol dehydrogenase
VSATATKAGVYAQRLIDNEYVQDNLSRGVESLQAAYERASKRRVSPTQDKKVLGQLQSAVLSISEAASAVKTGRQKPKPRWGRRVIVVVGLGAAGAAAVLAANEELRNKVLGGDSVASPDVTQAMAGQATAATNSETSAVA